MTSNLVQLNLLLVEDSDEHTEIIEYNLTKFKAFRITTTRVSTMAAARPLIYGDTFDIILLDLNLPDSRRDATLESLREFTSYRAPVVILTSLGDDESGHRAVLHGAQDFLCKSFDDSNTQTLERAIRYAVQRQQLRLELLEAKRDAERAQTHFRQLLACLPTGVVATVGGVIRLTNWRTLELFGYTEEQLMGRPLTDLIPDMAQTVSNLSVDANAHTCPSSKPEDERETTAIRSNGRSFPVSIALTTLPSPGETWLLAAISDRTEIVRSRIALENKTFELQHTNQELEQFAYIVSHDLQAPLRSLRFAIDRLARDVAGGDGSGVLQGLENASQSAHRMQQLIKDLLQFSRIGRDALQLEEVDLNQIIQTVCNDLNEQIIATQAELSTTELPKMRLSPTMIYQVFQNLISNAIKFRSDKPPRIEINARTEEGHGWTFSVSDNGLGFSPDDAKTIFQPFRRLTHHQSREGTGIGLSIVQRIVERHQGKIWVDSQVGKGSVFYFFLPSHLHDHALVA